MSEFKVLGTRVLLNKPEAPKSVIELSAEAKAEVEYKLIEQYKKLVVYAVGEDCVKVKVGDSIYVPTYALQNADVIAIEADEFKFMIRETDVAIIY